MLSTFYYVSTILISQLYMVVWELVEPRLNKCRGLFV
jgi:hypothetical protein